MINNLEAYKVFYYVAKCGSVTKAAGELSISQPAVSQAIKQLENTLDAALFHRAAKGVRLTSEGELLYSYVAKGYEQIEMGVKKVHQMQNMELGEVRIGASDMTLQFYLLPYLEKFHEQYPGIKVIVTNAREEDFSATRTGRWIFRNWKVCLLFSWRKIPAAAATWMNFWRETGYMCSRSSNWPLAI